MGTARMGINPKYSVVNEWGRLRDVVNLYRRQQHICYSAGKSSVNKPWPYILQKNQK